MGEGFIVRGKEYIKPITQTYLYNEGDKCVDITGGWRQGFDWSGSISDGGTYLKIYGMDAWECVNTIDLSGFGKVFCIADVVGSWGADELFGWGIIIADTSKCNISTSGIAKSITKMAGNNIQIECDVSAINGSKYLQLFSYGKSTTDVRFKKVWGE